VCNLQMFQKKTLCAENGTSPHLCRIAVLSYWQPGALIAVPRPPASLSLVCCIPGDFDVTQSGPLGAADRPLSCQQVKAA
jgi:hypothetical protein